jgi:hypothetical protein
LSSDKTVAGVVYMELVALVIKVSFLNHWYDTIPSCVSTEKIAVCPSTTP